MFLQKEGSGIVVETINASHWKNLKEEAEATSSIANLTYIDHFLSNKFAFLRFNFKTGDAAGQNMVGRATFAACGWILDHYEGIENFYLESNFATDKKASQINISLQTPDEESFKTRKARKMDFDQYKEKILEFLKRCLKQKSPPKIKIHFLNTKFTSEVPGEHWTLGTMDVLNNTQDLQRTFTYWAEAIHAIYPQNGNLERVKEKIKKLSVFKWNVVEILPNLYFETYILDTWGNAFVGDNVVPSRVQM